MSQYGRDTKTQNFPVGRISRAKFFRTECVNCFCNIYVPKVGKLLLRHICAKSAIAYATYMQKCQNNFYKSARYGCCDNNANNPGKKPYSLETVHTVRKLSILSGNFHTVKKISRLSGNFTNRLENFQTVWKLFRPPGNFQDRLKTFQTIWKLSIPSGRFPDHQEAFQNIRPSVKAGWEFSSIFRNFPGFQFGPFQCSYGQIKQFTVIVCFIAIT